jgi:hypothetical protein
VPRLLDLCCGLGGISVGYYRAGFEVMGVDSVFQKDYPFDFWETDALTLDPEWIASNFDAVHASWPCQAYTALASGTNAHFGDKYPKLTEPGRELMQATGLPYVIENPAARPDVVLCGTTLGLSVIRHRNFELGGWKMPQPKHITHAGKVRGWRHGAYSDGVWPDGRTVVAVYGKGGGKASLAEAKTAMGIDWSNDYDQVIEAVPPLYGEVIGRALLAHLAG